MGEATKRLGASLGIRALLFALLMVLATEAQEREDLQLQIDHHVHIISPQLLKDWKAVGMRFSRQDEFYSNPVKVLEILNCQRVIALSMAHLYTSEWFAELENIENNRMNWVRRENNFVAETARQHPNRILGFFSINPRMAGWKTEFDRCAALDGISGLKLHLPACGMQIQNNEHFASLKQVVKRCGDNGLPILIHLDGLDGEFDQNIAAKFWSEIVAPNPKLTLVLAHLGSTGGFNDRSEALFATYRAACEKSADFSRMEIYFDLSGAVLLEETDGLPATSEERCQELAETMRKVGLKKFLPASDYPAFAPGDLAISLRDRIGLTPKEIAEVISNTPKATRRR